MTTKTKVTRYALALIAALSFLLSACKPENIVMTNTSFEQRVQTFVHDTCPQRADGTCKAIGE